MARAISPTAPAGSSMCWPGRSFLPEENLARFLVHGRLDVDFLGAGISALRSGPGPDGLEPPLQLGETVQILTLPLVGYNPGVNRHIGDGVLRADELATAKMAVQNAVQARGFIYVAL